MIIKSANYPEALTLSPEEAAIYNRSKLWEAMHRLTVFKSGQIVGGVQEIDTDTKRMRRFAKNAAGAYTGEFVEDTFDRFAVEIDQNHSAWDENAFDHCKLATWREGKKEN